MRCFWNIRIYYSLSCEPGPNLGICWSQQGHCWCQLSCQLWCSQIPAESSDQSRSLLSHGLFVSRNCLVLAGQTTKIASRLTTGYPQAAARVLSAWHPCMASLHGILACLCVFSFAATLGFVALRSGSSITSATLKQLKQGTCWHAAWIFD